VVLWAERQFGIPYFGQFCFVGELDWMGSERWLRGSELTWGIGLVRRFLLLFTDLGG